MRNRYSILLYQTRYNELVARIEWDSQGKEKYTYTMPMGTIEDVLKDVDLVISRIEAYNYADWLVFTKG